ncbi:hypothetical protein LMG3431_02294 [Achromobacter pestifer]|uniref:DUF469 family protein n=2 Tax=Achromobacter pestifer TaxID=1353889 RepID=A0A6S6YTG5_9BURK|nr:hypothetical protein LMG3431_02294 [Achromobacter pestifer]
MLIHTPSRKRIRRLNVRQRKKLRVGEFRESCFEVKIRFKQPLTELNYGTWWGAVVDLIEANHLLICGIGGQLPLIETNGIVSAADRKSPTEEDRLAVLAGLQGLTEVASVQVGDFVCAWYGPFDI